MTKYKSDYNPIKDYWIAIENGEVVSAKVKKVYAFIFPAILIFFAPK